MHLPINKTTSKTLLTCVLSAACLMAGCQPKDALNRKVSANAPIDFALWRAHVVDQLTPDQWKDFDEAIQEIRFRIMIDRKATGSDAIEEVMLEKINKLTIRAVIQTGYRSEWDRLNAEFTELETVIRKNARIRTGSDDRASTDFLKSLRDDQRERMETVIDGITRTEEKLRFYDPDFNKEKAN